MPVQIAGRAQCDEKRCGMGTTDLPRRRAEVERRVGSGRWGPGPGAVYPDVESFPGTHIELASATFL